MEDPLMIDPIALSQVAEEYASFVGTASSRIRIFSGEAHLRLYSHPQVIDAFRAAKRKAVVTQIIAGPVLSVFRRAAPRAWT